MPKAPRKPKTPNHDENEAKAKAFFDTLRPDVERLVRKVEDNQHACITGIVLSQDPPALLHIGNIENEGEDLIRLHMVLSTFVAQARENPKYKNLTFEEIGLGNALIGEAPEEIADKLAEMMLVTNLHPEYAGEILEMAQKYLASRAPRKK